jgi:hypothetical protein
VEVDLGCNGIGADSVCLFLSRCLLSVSVPELTGTAAARRFFDGGGIDSSEDDAGCFLLEETVPVRIALDVLAFADTDVVIVIDFDLFCRSL